MPPRTHQVTIIEPDPLAPNEAWPRTVDVDPDITIGAYDFEPAEWTMFREVSAERALRNLADALDRIQDQASDHGAD